MMQQLHTDKIAINVNNLVLMQNKEIVKAFAKKHKISFPLSEDTISDELTDVGTDSTEKFFEDALAVLHDEAFAHYVEDTLPDFSYELSYRNRPQILARAKSIIKLHDILYASKLKNRTDHIADTFTSVNKGGAYLRMSSPQLTAILGGWSRGYVGSAIGRPSHNKSTWFSYDSTWQIKKNNVSPIHVIASEESPASFWRRIFGIELNVPIRAMIEGNIKLSNEDLRKVKDVYEDKLVFHSIRNFSDVIDLIFSLNGIEYIWLDHINSIVYPQGNMFTGIQSLIGYQKQWLEKNPDSVIVDLSQVNTKEMKRKNRLFPHKEDAYNSSILEQASREFLSFYYPYKDAIDPETRNRFAGKGAQCKPDMIQVSVEKNSYGDVGVMDMGYSFEFGKFEDRDSSKMKPEVILPEDIELKLPLG